MIDKVNQDAKRAKELDRRNEQLMLDRQRNQIGLIRQKRALLHMFEALKSQKNWNKLSKIDLSKSASAAHLNGQTRPMSKSSSMGVL